MATILSQICQRTSTAAEWAAVNPVLALGEVGYESDSGWRKTGDEVTPWNGLLYDHQRLPTQPAAGGGSRGTYLSLPGRYTPINTTHTLPEGTQDVDLKWGSGRELEPGIDYTLTTDPPTVTITASLDYYEGERVWGRTYRSNSRTYLSLPTRYGAGYPPVELPAGTRDVAVFWGSGRELEPGIGYNYDPATRLLTLTANTDTYGGERIWLWLYS